MFGFIKKRVRQENIKLLTQNAMAFDYLADFDEMAAATGGQCLGLSQEAPALLEDLYQLADRVSQGEELAGQALDASFGFNKQMRRLYDQVLAGRRAFANSFGSSSERLEPFDKKFAPNVGWKIFSEHFSGRQSIEDLLK